MAFISDDFWQAYAEVYALMENISFVREQHARHLGALTEAQVILDAGCGIASLTVALAKEPHRQLLAIDNNPMMLSVAGRRLLSANGSPRFFLSRGDLGALPYLSATVEGYLSNNVLHCVEHEQAVLDEMARVVRPGGRACIASARPCMDVELLLRVMEAELRELGEPGAVEGFQKFATVNRSLQRRLTNLHEPDEFAERLERSRRWRVLEATTTYLEQNFFVVATRV